MSLPHNAEDASMICLETNNDNSVYPHNQTYRMEVIFIWHH